jgi:hypothetical protein
MPTKTRISRIDTRQPIVRNGKVVEVTPTEREEQDLFPILDDRRARYPWAYDMLPRHYIGALLPDWGPEYLRKRLPKLTHEPNNYLRLPEMQTGNGKFGSRHLIYAHADTALNEDEFWHDLMPNMIACQIEIGVRQNPDLQIVNFDRILNAPSMPADGPRAWTVEIPRPDIVTRGKPKKAKPWRVTPDWQIFGIGKADASAFRWYCGIEADKGTEPLRRNNNPRKSIQSMLRRMLEIDELGLARTLYGLPEFYFTIVTARSDTESMIEVLYELTDGIGHPRIIFNTFPVYNSFRTPPEPDGSWFRSTFLRAAGKDATWTKEYRLDQL